MGWALRPSACIYRNLKTEGLRPNTKYVKNVKRVRSPSHGPLTQRKRERGGERITRADRDEARVGDKTPTPVRAQHQAAQIACPSGVTYLCQWASRGDGRPFAGVAVRDEN